MSEGMLAARFYEPNQPLVLEEAPLPRPGSGEVLVEVRACGLCGSDIHIIKGETLTGSRPITLGHEAAGLVAELGPDCGQWQVGDRVAVNCVMSCGLCFNCQRGRDSICLNRRLTGIHLDGALARYVKVKSRSLIALPQEIPFEQGAIATDAVATPYHALTTRGGLRSGQAVAIFGAGGLGAHAIKLARLMGATPIIALDLSKPVLARARRFGADETVNAAQQDPVAIIRELTNGRGVDVALECVGTSKTVRWAVESAAVGGRAVVVGLTPEEIHLGEITNF
ncbi:MAG: zinc-binding dehydrogenase, partial [Deltaproteobacteria bacterium]|nr:zinc-binding dehydrogenase [Deltaproteobacteria bacterium]